MKKAIIYVPGLNDDKFFNSKFINLLPLIWNRYGYDVFIVRPEWRKGKTFYPKQTLIINKIDELFTKGYAIYLFGQSAGGLSVIDLGAVKGSTNLYRTAISQSGLGSPGSSSSVPYPDWLRRVLPEFHGRNFRRFPARWSQRPRC